MFGIEPGWNVTPLFVGGTEFVVFGDTKLGFAAFVGRFVETGCSSDVTVDENDVIDGRCDVIGGKGVVICDVIPIW